eukprot:2570815-Rhodomonas_salina.1
MRVGGVRDRLLSVLLRSVERRFGARRVGASVGMQQKHRRFGWSIGLDTAGAYQVVRHVAGVSRGREAKVLVDPNCVGVLARHEKVRSRDLLRSPESSRSAVSTWQRIAKAEERSGTRQGRKEGESTCT